MGQQRLPGQSAGRVEVPPEHSVESWFAYEGTPLESAVRDALARVTHAGFFETNARPYQHLTYHAILTLASFAQNELIQTEAENALHYLSTKLAFQSIDGRRHTPMRRNCEYANDPGLYVGDGTSPSIGLLSGAYKWNDSPYGLRPSMADSYACFSGMGDCHWHQYTWKHTEDENETDNVADDDSGLEGYRHNAGGQPKVIWTAFGRYRAPRAIHDFMLNDRGGYFARMMPRFDRDHYFPTKMEDLPMAVELFKEPLILLFSQTVADIAGSRYFRGDDLAESGLYNRERSPELYFKADGVMNAAGGTYNPYAFSLESSYTIRPSPFRRQGSPAAPALAISAMTCSARSRTTTC